MKKILFLLFMPIINFAQTKINNTDITFSSYVEPYYSYNFSEFLSNENTQFNYIYNHNANKQINLNLAMIKLNYNTNNTRANIALMTGTYAIANLANEPSAVKNILEANAGVKISKKKNIWLDAGVMPSHIGYESAIGKDNLTLTRSLMAENSPYFETGAKLSYTSNNQKLYIGALVLNGWQTIIPTKSPGIHLGAQITYTPSQNFKINYSNYYGYNNAIDERNYHDFFVEFSKRKTKMVALFDVGYDKLQSNRFKWFTYCGMVQQKLNDKNSITARLEYFNDNNFIFTSSQNLIAKNPLSVSVNYDYQINTHALLRIEPKYVHTNNHVDNYKKTVQPYIVFSSSLCIHF